MTVPPSLVAEKQAAVKLPEGKVKVMLPVLPEAGQGPPPPGESAQATSASARAARVQWTVMGRMLVNIDVDDLERATRFYTQALGLRVGRRFGAAAIEPRERRRPSTCW